MNKIISTRIIYDSFDNEKYRFICEETLYENIDQILQQTEFGENGSIQSKLAFKYFATGNLKSRIESNEFNEIVKATDYEEDSEGNLTNVIHSYMDGSQEKETYSYVNGNIREIIIKDDDENTISIKSFKCDEKGNAIEELIDDCESKILYKRVFGENDFPIREECFLDGQLKNIEFFEYDTNDYVIKRILQDSKGNIIEKEETDRDKTGQIEKTQFWSQESDQKNVAIYSRVNNTTEIDTYINDEIHQHQCFKFNEDGEVVFSKTIAPQHGVNEEVLTEYIKVD